MGKDSDIAEVGRAIDSHNKFLRDQNWENRASGIKVITDTGFKVVCLSEGNRHYRIPIDGFGWVDFWPSSWKWCESPRPNHQRLRRGSGLASLIAHLKGLSIKG